MREKKSPRLLLAATIIAYCLIGVEIIIMISPFALYFYSVYGPILNFLSASPLTSWTTEFFLPHMVFPDDPLILWISYLQILLVVGLVLFFSAAIPLYWGRFTGRGVVQISFYKKIRHPQYLFLAISGFGLLLYWPRFIILFMYITMLFVYYLLARNEEWRMKQEEPQTYRDYMANTPMFLPGEPGGKIYDTLFGRIKPKWLGLIVLYLVTVTITMLLAVGLRSYTVSRIPNLTADSRTLVSVFPRPADELKEVYQQAMARDEVSSLVNSDKGANLVYIMPGDFFLTALVTDENRRFTEDMIERFPEILEWHQHKFRGGIRKFFKIFYNFVRTLGTARTDYDIERLIFVRVTDGRGQPVAAGDIFAMGLDRYPVMIVDLDAYSLEVMSVVNTSGEHKWGKMPMPTF